MAFLGGSLSTLTKAPAITAVGNEAFVAGINTDAAINHFVIPGLGAIGADALDLTGLLGGVSAGVLQDPSSLSSLVGVGRSTGAGINWHTTVSIQNGNLHAQVILQTSGSISTGVGTNGLSAIYPSLILPTH